MNLYLTISGKSYSVSTIAVQIRALEDHKDYEMVKDLIIDNTMSCNKEEAKAYMLWIMKEAITEGLKHEGEEQTDQRIKFLVAYNLYVELSK